MKYDAVIFDLFGTLVDKFRSDDFKYVLAEMADCMQLPREKFARVWYEDEFWIKRSIGELATTSAVIEYACNLLGGGANEEQLKTAAHLRTEYTRSALVPRPDVAETVTYLKEKGYKVGLISDCTSEVPELWPQTPLSQLIDDPIFSCSVGLKKPDARIYLLACERLGVSPDRCLYMGDGGSRELGGATSVGMKAVLIRVAHESEYDPHCEEAEEWQGPRVATVKEIVAHL